MCAPIFKMPSSLINYRQLKTVFMLLGPDECGRVTIEQLQNLAQIHGHNDPQDMMRVLRQLDRHGKGSLSFKEFCYAVKVILRQNTDNGVACREGVMSPIMAAPDVNHNGNTTSPESRYVLTPSESPTRTENNKSQCSSLSDGENFECYGEAPDIEVESTLPADRTNGDVPVRSPLNGISRHTWSRTSLRRSPPNHLENLPNRRWGSFRHTGKRQLGSNALASQLYRSSSFNSSGRSSTCDTADDMYSDASLEEDVLDLNHKVQVLQQQVGVLTDSAHHTDERYTRAKADNAALQARVIMLEEQLRETEMRHEERLQDEQRRTKELLSRVEREKQLQLENSSIRLHAAELESSGLKEEVQRQRQRIEKMEKERQDSSDQIQDLRNEVMSYKEQENLYKENERRLIQDQKAQAQLVEELSKEVERLKSEARTPALPTTSPETLRLEELHEEMAALRTKNTQLQEANEELQASLLHAGVEQGRLLTASENSLAAELEAMTHDEQQKSHDAESLAKIQKALKEQQEVNAQLRHYIDGILLDIVENYPQLLEVKRSG